MEDGSPIISSTEFIQCNEILNDLLPPNSGEVIKSVSKTFQSYSWKENGYKSYKFSQVFITF